MELNALSMIGERRCGYKPTLEDANPRWSLEAELWIAVRLTRLFQPLSNKKLERIFLLAQGYLRHLGVACYETEVPST